MRYFLNINTIINIESVINIANLLFSNFSLTNLLFRVRMNTTKQTKTTQEVQTHENVTIHPKSPYEKADFQKPETGNEKETETMKYHITDRIEDQLQYSDMIPVQTVHGEQDGTFVSRI